MRSGARGGEPDGRRLAKERLPATGRFWVWLFINEVPSMMTLVGGAIVLSGVLAQAYLSSARPKMA